MAGFIKILLSLKFILLIYVAFISNHLAYNKFKKYGFHALDEFLASSN